MSEKLSKLYVKFKNDEDSPLINSFLVTQNKEDAKDWPANEADFDSGVDGAEGEDYEIETEQKTGDFIQLSREFCRATDSFFVSIPFIMGVLPVMLQAHVKQTLHKFCHQTGQRIEDNDTEYYEIPMSRQRELLNHIEEIDAIGTCLRSLPSMFVVRLVSIFDDLVAGLVRSVLIRHPDIISSSDRSISFKDLMNYGSVDEARESIIESEIDSLMRGSRANQVKWFETKLELKIRNSQLWPSFVEVCERRNVLTHAGGHVSRQYLNVCTENGFDLSELSIGDKLSVNRKYCSNAVSTITKFGIQLIQVIWRKLIPADIELARSELNQNGYRLISQNRYGDAVELFKFALLVLPQKGSDDSYRKMITINYANTLKLSGDEKEAESVLSKEDWSATKYKFLICVAAIRNETNEVIGLLEKVVKNNELTVSELRYWPVFETVRREKAFLDEFARLFDENLITDQTSALADLADASNEPDDKP